ncbi:MAG: hypothetical protein R3F30_06000 [Planctomycetota bacterium]
MHPEQGKERAVIERFQARFRPHCEDMPDLKVTGGQAEGTVSVVATLTPKVTEDRQRLFFLLREHLWTEPYKGGRPERIVARLQDPVTKQVQELVLPDARRRSAPTPQKKAAPGAAKPAAPTSRPATGSAPDRRDVEPGDPKR